MNAHRIPNGTLIEIVFDDWIGVVVDQSGPNVLITARNGCTWYARDSIDRSGRITSRSGIIHHVYV